MTHVARSRPWSPPQSMFAGFRFPAEVIMVAVRWYLRYGLSYRDVEELLVERGIDVDHVTVFRWVQRFTCCWPTLPGSLATHRPIAGSWMRPTSRSAASGGTSTARSTSRAGYRRPALRPPRRQGRPPVLQGRATDPQGDTERGGHRRRADLRRRARRADPFGLASRRTLPRRSGGQTDHRQDSVGLSLVTGEAWLAGDDALPGCVATRSL